MTASLPAGPNGRSRQRIRSGPPCGLHQCARGTGKGAPPLKGEEVHLVCSARRESLIWVTVPGPGDGLPGYIEAAAELLIAKSWLHRDDFTSQLVAVHPGIGSGQLMTVIDWPAAVAALGTSLACSGGEQRMLKITASLADGIPVDLQDTLTGLETGRGTFA